MNIFIITVVMTALILELISLKGRSNPVQYSIKPSVQACEPGQQLEVESSFKYYGSVPAIYFQVEEVFPKGITMVQNPKLTEEALKGQIPVKSGFMLHAMECLKRKQKISFAKRGVYQFGECTVMQGDFLGLHKLLWNVDTGGYVFVYPQRYESGILERNMQQMYEDIAMRRSLLRDSIQVIGYHDYTGREPMKQIAYKQSAKQNRWMVREYEFVNEERMRLVLDLNYKGEPEEHFKRIELLLSITRTMIEWLERKAIPYRVITNASLFGYEPTVQSFDCDEAKSKSNLKRLLNVLACSDCGAVCSTKQLWEYVLAGKKCDSIIYMATGSEPETEKGLRNLRRQNIQVYPYYASMQQGGKKTNENL